MTLRKLLCIHLGKDKWSDLPVSVTQAWNVHSVHTLQEAARLIKNQQFLLGLMVQDENVATEWNHILEFLDTHQQLQWVMLFTEQGGHWPQNKTQIVQHLFDYHTQPVDAMRLNHTLGHAYGYAQIQAESRQQGQQHNGMGLVGQSAAIAQLRLQIRKVAQAQAPVLISGESGTGKELTAQAIHHQSHRAKAPLIAVNCGAIPANLIQSELFGYERGAFTGAARDKRGLIESANNGTLFLDEIADLPLELQVNMLRFLQEGTINRVGSSQAIKLDVRVVAASHVHLEDAVRAGRFREDLMYRLNVLPLHVPALRERKEDLELLVKHFFEHFAHDKNPRLQGWTQQAMRAIQAYDWPGNVRELGNKVRRAMVMAEGRWVTPHDLGLRTPEPATTEAPCAALDDARTRAEHDTIRDVLHRRAKNITHAARDLGISRMTLYRLLDKHSLRA